MPELKAHGATLDSVLQDLLDGMTWAINEGLDGTARNYASCYQILTAEKNHIEQYGA